jgi:serine palmitoyltransferase
VGALGTSGRGILEHYGILESPKNTIRIGTFSKAFASMGGFLVGERALIECIRAEVWRRDLPLPLCTLVHVTGVLDCLEHSKVLVALLQENAAYVRSALRRAGFRVLGHQSSPVIPVMAYAPRQFLGLSRRALDENLALVVAGYPATPVMGGRIRICVSAAHTRPDLEKAVQTLICLGAKLGLLYDK